jgi:guanylate kinase
MGNYYGTLKSEIINKTKTDSMLLDIEPVGALRVREIFPEATLIYIAPPSLEALEQRLRGRNDTSEEQMKLRRERAVWESSQMEKYDHVVVNDILENCVEAVLQIIRDKMNHTY